MPYVVAKSGTGKDARYWAIHYGKDSLYAFRGLDFDALAEDCLGPYLYKQDAEKAAHALKERDGVV